MMFFALSCSSNIGDAFLYVVGIANYDYDNRGIPLYTEVTNTGVSYTNFRTDEFYISIESIKIKSREKDWVSVFESSFSYPQNYVNSFNLVNGVVVPATEYNVILIGYRANWYVVSGSTRVSNSTSQTIYYAAFYNDVSLFNEVSNRIKNIFSSVFWNSSFFLFAGETKWLYLYFDTENILKGLTNHSGIIIDYCFIPPKFYIELR